MGENLGNDVAWTKKKLQQLSVRKLLTMVNDPSQKFLEKTDLVQQVLRDMRSRDRFTVEEKALESVEVLQVERRPKRPRPTDIDTDRKSKKRRIETVAGGHGSFSEQQDAEEDIEMTDSMSPERQDAGTRPRVVMELTESKIRQDDDGVESSNHALRPNLPNDAEILAFLRENIIGRDEIFQGPFGPRRIMYCDWTASGKSLRCLENYIRNEVLTLYANTHTETSVTGIQMTHYRQQSRQIILRSVHGRELHDTVLFAGTGATGAIAKMAGVLERWSSFDPKSTAVFIGPYEHNSNILIWKEMGVALEILPESKAGGVDQVILENKLKDYKKNRFRILIGSFNAASNVTGICEDTENVTKLLHSYDALSFWDFASGAPYLDIRMTCRTCERQSKVPKEQCACFDAVFISPHKFMGGPNTPGVLVVKNSAMLNDIPVIPGGGTVSYAFGAKGSEYEYKEDASEREEGGTQDIVGSIRAGLAFLVKDAVGVNTIENKERSFIKRVFDIWGRHPDVHIVGHDDRVGRLATFSFFITHTRKMMNTKPLHHNFVAALLNDLFGIQGRGGCSCAGLYGKNLLKLEEKDLEQFVCAVQRGNELSKPGFMRVNFHYTMTDAEVNFVIEAVLFIANHGWKFIPCYRPVSKTGEWTHFKLENGAYHPRSLFSIKFGESMEYDSHHARELNDNYDNYLQNANEIVKSGIEYPREVPMPTDNEARWYWAPIDITI